MGFMLVPIHNPNELASIEGWSRENYLDLAALYITSALRSLALVVSDPIANATKLSMSLENCAKYVLANTSLLPQQV